MLWKKNNKRKPTKKLKRRFIKTNLIQNANVQILKAVSIHNVTLTKATFCLVKELLNKGLPSLRFKMM